MDKSLLNNNNADIMPFIGGGGNTKTNILANAKSQNKAPIPTGKRGNSTKRGAGFRQIGSMIS